MLVILCTAVPLVQSQSHTNKQNETILIQLKYAFIFVLLFEIISNEENKTFKTSSFEMNERLDSVK